MRHSVLREEYVKEHNITCELCNEPAYVTWYDINWKNHELCKYHMESIEEDIDYLQKMREAYEEELK